MYALELSSKPATNNFTFGWHRAEIIGTLLSMLVMIIVTLLLLQVTIIRITNPDPEYVDGKIMLITAGGSIFFHIV